MIVYKYCSNLKTNIALDSTIAARFTALVLLAFDFGFDWLNMISHYHLRYLPHHCLDFLKLSQIKMISDPSSSWLYDVHLKSFDQYALRFDHLDYYWTLSHISDIHRYSQISSSWSLLDSHDIFLCVLVDNLTSRDLDGWCHISISLQMISHLDIVLDDLTSRCLGGWPHISIFWWTISHLNILLRMISHLIIVAARLAGYEVKEPPRWAGRQHLATHLKQSNWFKLAPGMSHVKSSQTDVSFFTSYLCLMTQRRIWFNKV